MRRSQKLSSEMVLELWRPCFLLLQSYNKAAMPTIKQRRRILKARVALALYFVLGRVLTDKEFCQVSLLIRWFCKTTPGLH